MTAVIATYMPAAHGSILVAAVVIVVMTLVELTLMAWAIIDLSHRRVVTWGNKWVWAVIIVVFGVIGPIVYFVAGRPPQQIDESGDEAARRGAGAGQRAGSAADLLYGPAGRAPADRTPAEEDDPGPAGADDAGRDGG